MKVSKEVLEVSSTDAAEATEHTVKEVHNQPHTEVETSVDSNTMELPTDLLLIHRNQIIQVVYLNLESEDYQQS